jgi:hypothetical protein
MSNARNLANLLGTGTTIVTAKIADDAITAAKIDDDGTGFTFGDVTVGNITSTGLTTGFVSPDSIILDSTAVTVATVNSAVSASATIVVDTVTGTIAVGQVVTVQVTDVRAIIDASSETAISVDKTLTITAVASQTSFTVSEAVTIADNVALFLTADGGESFVLDASAASTDVGGKIQFEDGTNDVSVVLSRDIDHGAFINLPTISFTPAFQAGRSGSNFTFSDNTYTKVTFNETELDTDNNFASDRFTPTTRGKYFVTITANMEGVNSYDMYNGNLSIYKNGAEIRQVGSQGNATSRSNRYGICLSMIVEMNGSTDYLEMYIYLNNSGAANGAIESSSLSFGAFRMIE